MPNYHLPVLTGEILRFLKPDRMNLVVDGTLGDGGHAELILKHTAPQCRLLGIDRDPSALKRATERLSKYKSRIQLVHGNFKDIKGILMKEQIDKIDGFLLDLGVSSLQLDTPKRGFSLKKDGPLDMRMDPEDYKTASDLLIESSDKELQSIIREYGEERFSKRIVRAIRKAQAKSPILTTLQFSRVISEAVRFARPTRIHHATRAFQALRIAVNDELESLRQGLEGFWDALNIAGKALIISFHSLEDRIVKRFFRERERGCICPSDFPICVCGKVPDLKVLTRKPEYPNEFEVKLNPRSSSAVLRVAEKLHV